MDVFMSGLSYYNMKYFGALRVLGDAPKVCLTFMQTHSIKPLRNQAHAEKRE